MICYIDASVLLRYLFGQGRNILKAAKFSAAGSSELIIIECRRVLYRYRLEGHLSDRLMSETYQALDEIINGFHLIEITTSIKLRASEPFPTIIGSPDAIHLASALLWQAEADEKIVLMSYDRQMVLCAHAMGIHTI